MVLSSYSNWETDFQNINPETVPVQADQQYWEPFDLPFAFVDPYIELNNNFLHPENYSPLLQLPPETISYESFSSFPCSKRQKLVEDQCLTPGFFDGVDLNSCPVLLQDNHHQIQSTNQVSSTKNGDEKCVSAQSIAARERRRKITRKTQELGKLVPGGTKMNTAEMLQSAFKYVKFLQAQLGILQLMNSFPETGENCKENESLQILASAKVQEKLYVEEKCLVPKDFVMSLTTISRPPLSDELTRLL
ncbi:hypothetical protein HRI_004962700 [Hibiscus trionum]|uniref:BHLH domain-containing protein n=1 Tax=Hibiscus trionum TaxID=183268 RepID=A0A9W7JE91_HIBTR|nr:hypothetical protein HRI_004962700 [Hibiscus trionum]